MDTYSHVQEQLRMSREAQAQGELEILRNENFRLKQLIKQLEERIRLLEAE